MTTKTASLSAGCIRNACRMPRAELSNLLEPLTSRLTTIQGRLLYIGTNRGDTPCHADSLPDGIHGQSYNRLHHVDTSRGLNLCGLDDATSGSFLVLLAEDDLHFQWRWFDPDPATLEPILQYEAIQRRKMSPLWALSQRIDGSWQEFRIYLVPEEVLRRPPTDCGWSCYGEPWCHRCNKTFFWQPAVDEIPIIGRSPQSLQCSRCWTQLPV